MARKAMTDEERFERKRERREREIVETRARGREGAAAERVAQGLPEKVDLVLPPREQTRDVPRE